MEKVDKTKEGGRGLKITKRIWLRKDGMWVFRDYERLPVFMKSWLHKEWNDDDIS